MNQNKDITPYGELWLLCRTIRPANVSLYCDRIVPFLKTLPDRKPPHAELQQISVLLTIHDFGKIPHRVTYSSWTNSPVHCSRKRFTASFWHKLSLLVSGVHLPSMTQTSVQILFTSKLLTPPICNRMCAPLHLGSENTVFTLLWLQLDPESAHSQSAPNRGSTTHRA